MSRRRSKTTLIVSAIFLLLLTVAALLVPSQDVSLEYHVWIKLPHSYYKNGDYVMFYHHNRKMIKQIRCSFGQYLIKLQNCFYCNGRKLACSKPYDRKGNPTPEFNMAGMIISGYFVMGTHPDSFDSRYFGLIQAERIINRVEPIL